MGELLSSSESLTQVITLSHSPSFQRLTPLKVSDEVALSSGDSRVGVLPPDHENDSPLPSPKHSSESLHSQ